MENKDSGLFRELSLSLKREWIQIKDNPTETKLNAKKIKSPRYSFLSLTLSVITSHWIEKKTELKKCSKLTEENPPLAS